MTFVPVAACTWAIAKVAPLSTMPRGGKLHYLEHEDACKRKTPQGRRKSLMFRRNPNAVAQHNRTVRAMHAILWALAVALIVAVGSLAGAPSATADTNGMNGVWRFSPGSLTFVYKDGTATILNASGTSCLNPGDTFISGGRATQCSPGPDSDDTRNCSPASAPAGEPVSCPVTLSLSDDGEYLTLNFPWGPNEYTRQDVVDHCLPEGADLAGLADAAGLDGNQRERLYTRPCAPANQMKIVASPADVTGEVGDALTKDGNLECGLPAKGTPEFKAKFMGKDVLLAVIEMRTDFCVDKKKRIVRGANSEDDAPEHAYFANYQNAPMGRFLTCEYEGAKDNDFADGYVDTKRRTYFTTGTIGIKCANPLAVLLAKAAESVGITLPSGGQVLLTATQYAYINGFGEIGSYWKYGTRS